MGLLTGSVSYLRFVAQPVPDDFERLYCEMLGQHVFRDIDPHGDLEESIGWVTFDDAFSSDFEPTTLVNRDGYLVLRLRIDKLKVPAATLKAYVAQAEREKAVASGRDKLSRRELDVLKLEVKKRLRLRSLPRMQLVEVAWNVATGEVRLISTSKAVMNLFVEKFDKTFAQNLMPVGLLSVLQQRGMAQTDFDALALIDGDNFHLQGRA